MNKLNLIIDIGNTTIAFGLFDEANYVSSFSISTHEKFDLNKLNEFLSGFEISDGMIFSVVPSAETKIKKIVKKITKLTLPIFDWRNYQYSKKDQRITDQIGADLIADLIGADKNYGSPSIIFDLGTVNKLLLVDKDGVFIGASFTPGVQLELDNFFSKTALLPHASDLNEVKKETGLDTASSMKHGVYWSLVSYIKSQKAIQEEILGYKLKLILTGGNSSVIEKEFDDKVYDPLLTLKGMNIMFREWKNEL